MHVFAVAEDYSVCAYPPRCQKSLQQIMGEEGNLSIEAKSIFIGLLLWSFKSRNDQKHNSVSPVDDF